MKPTVRIVHIAMYSISHPNGVISLKRASTGSNYVGKKACNSARKIEEVGVALLAFLLAAI
jgi:hypothetical protein